MFRDMNNWIKEPSISGDTWKKMRIHKFRNIYLGNSIPVK